MITFTVNWVAYQAEEGMTWEEWVNSDYSGGGFSIDGNKVLINNYSTHIANVLSSDVIISNRVYVIDYSGGSGGS